MGEHRRPFHRRALGTVKRLAEETAGAKNLLTGTIRMMDRRGQSGLIPGDREPRPTMMVIGDAQARGLAMAFARIPGIASRWDVIFHTGPLDASTSTEHLGRCAFSLEQYEASPALTRRLPRGCKRITFPHLRLSNLWPLACGNPYSPSDADNSIGPFPLADRFVLSSLERGVPPEEILRLLLVPTWHESWPDLEALLQAERAALLAADAKCDVKIGSYALKYFRKRRLFWAPNAPSNLLLCELAYRLLHATFGREMPADREAIKVALNALSARDVMSHVAIPIHPLVAEHFALEWYEWDERYPYDGGSRTFEEYYRAMIESISSALSQARQPASDRG